MLAVVVADEVSATSVEDGKQVMILEEALLLPIHGKGRVEGVLVLHVGAPALHLGHVLSEHGIAAAFYAVPAAAILVTTLHVGLATLGELVCNGLLEELGRLALQLQLRSVAYDDRFLVPAARG